MRMTFGYLWKAAGLTLAILPAGCNKLLEVPANTGGNLVTSQVFTDSASAVKGVLGLYTSSALSSQLPDIEGGLSSDELLTISLSSSDIAFYRDSLYAGTAQTAGPTYIIWNAFYSNNAIYQANAALEALSTDNLLTPGTRAQLIGECLLMRAFYYFYLVNLFGDVPYVTGTSYKVNAQLPRTAVATVYSNMERDLLRAAGLLSAAYPTSGRQRPNRYTAEALLARLYLYRRQWDKAQACSDTILNSGLYTLVPDLNGVFLDGSKEAIWQIGNGSPIANGMAPGYALLLPLLPSLAPKYSISPFLVQAFDSGDLRKNNWTAVSTAASSGGTVCYPYKYKNSFYSNPIHTTEDLMLFRLAEIYLIRAEARAQQGDLAGAGQDINIIRARAGLPGLGPPASLEEAIRLILHERQVELFAEWGHRWFDLKRSDSVNVVMGREKPQYWAADGHDALYPIPSTEIARNPSLTQNPGY